MFCPVCGAAELVHGVHAIAYTYKGRTTSFQLEGDKCRHAVRPFWRSRNATGWTRCWKPLSVPSILFLTNTKPRQDVVKKRRLIIGSIKNAEEKNPCNCHEECKITDYAG